MMQEHQAVADLLMDATKRAKFAYDSFQNKDFQKCGLRLKQAEEALRRANDEFTNFCMFHETPE